MKWKFWTRTKAEPAAQPSIESIQWPTDSYESVRMLARIHADRDITLFSGWRADGVKLPEELEQLTEVGCRGLMLALWFWRFEDSHGALAGRMARDEFQLVLNEVSENLGDMTMSLIGMMDRSKDSFIKMPEERRRVTVDGKSIELPFQWFCALTLLVQTTDSPYYGRDDSEFDGIELPMMRVGRDSCEKQPELSNRHLIRLAA